MNLNIYLHFVPASSNVNLRLAVEDDSLSATWILRLDIVVVNLERCIGAGTCQPYDMMFSVVNFDGHFTQTVIVRPNVVRRVQMTIHLFRTKKADQSRFKKKSVRQFPWCKGRKSFTRVSSRKSLDEALVMRINCAFSWTVMNPKAKMSLLESGRRSSGKL